MDFGSRIKQRRLDLGLTTEDVARIVGVSNATISRWETGAIRNQRRDKIELLAAALQTTPAELMGWSGNSPTIAADTITYKIIGEVAAGYDKNAVQDWDGAAVEVPLSYLRGHKRDDFFVLRVKGDSMYPNYQDGDLVLVLMQEALDRSGEIAVVLYGDENATLKRVDYVSGGRVKLVPVNPQFPPVTLSGEELEHFRILGLPRLLIRNIHE